MPRAPRRRRKLAARHKNPGLDVDGPLFRAKIRLTAIGYGAREQAWRLSRGFEYRVEQPLRGFWLGLRRSTRRIVVAGAALALVLWFLLYAPVPGVPCQVSAVKECAPTDDVLSMVPADALLYSHLTLDRGSAQLQAVDSLLGRFSPDRVDQIGTALLPAPSGVGISFAKDIRPWAGNDAALVIVPGPAPATSSAFVISVKDQKGADAFRQKIAPRGAGITSAFDRGFLVVGGGPAVRAVAATGAAGAKTLGETPSAEQVRGELPGNRFADLYFSRQGIRRLLAGSTTTLATQLETFVDYGASSGFAIAAVAKDDGVELDVYSALDPAKQRSSPNLFTTLPHFKPALTGDVGARALGYVGLGEAGESLGLLLQRAGGAEPGLESALKAFTDRISAEGKVDPARDLLPALGGQAALVAQPTDGIPFASLIVDDVDEPKAKEVLAQLQGPLARSLGSPPGQPPAAFRPITLHGGVEGSELQVSPTVDLTYAVFDGKLVISTQPAGVEQVAAGSGETLDHAAAFHDATAALPDQVSALLYLNLDELLDLAEKLGQVEDPLYVAFRDDIRKLHAIAVGVDAGAHDLRSRLFITIS
jgi:hypothetical protein